MCHQDSFWNEIITKKSLFLNNIRFYCGISYNLYTKHNIRTFNNKHLKIKSSTANSTA
jgi:hypothetical protein